MKLNHPSSAKISYITLPNQNEELIHQETSLDQQISHQDQDEELIHQETSPDQKSKFNYSIYTIFNPNNLFNKIVEMDNTQKMIVLYGISHYLRDLHKTSAHGRLKATNVQLDSNLYPIVSDPFIYELYQKTSKSIFKQTVDHIITLSKETLANGTINTKTDIYSFGILALQILTYRIIHSSLRFTLSRKIRNKFLLQD